MTEITALALFQVFLIFCRIGSAIMILPGFGDVYVTPRARLMMALLFSLVMYPLLSAQLPVVPSSPLELAAIVSMEVIVGLFIGGVARILQGLLHIAGMIIAFQSSLASALLFDASQGSQGSVIGNFMTILGVTLLFVSDLHHVVIQGLLESYNVFDPGVAPMTGDMAMIVARVLSDGMMVAFKISSPMVVVSLCLYLGSGMMARLMPNMQVFFVMIPLQIMIAFTFFALTMSAGMLWYLEHFKTVMSGILGL